MLKIVLNPNKQLVEEIDRKLADNKQKYGKAYCPCMIIHSEATVCMCDEFRNNEEMPECHCGKFIRVKE